MQRRTFLGTAFAAGLVPVRGLGQGDAEDFTTLAQRLSRQPHRDPAMQLAPPFDNLTYDSFRAIRPAEGGAAGLPLGGGVSADLLPPGFFFRDRVAIEIERNGEITPIGFDPALFSYGARYFDSPPQMDDTARAEMGFSGLRLRSAYRQLGVSDEFFVTQGASYFRTVSRQTLYGLSFRALAIGTGGGAPEEFPVFTRLRLREGSDGQARLEALIESPSITGAATFAISPGEPTVTDVDLVLFPRVTLDDIGIAPLTSMYLKGALRAAVSDDFRPRVHDSEALQIINGAGERLWRPLSNPATLQISRFADDGPRGFGLIQQSREFADFEDPEAAYHKRPSAWIAPRENWGEGGVMLVEIPTADEFHDNIVAFWRPGEPLTAGGVYRYSYRIFTGASPVPLPAPRVRIAQSRSGLVHDAPGYLQYIIDFHGDLGADLYPTVTASEGEIAGVSAYPVAARGHLRVGFRYAPGAAEAAELRLVLRDASGTPQSDVWLHRWTPARDGGP